MDTVTRAIDGSCHRIKPAARGWHHNNLLNCIYQNKPRSIEIKAFPVGRWIWAMFRSVVSTETMEGCRDGERERGIGDRGLNPFDAGLVGEGCYMNRLTSLCGSISPPSHPLSLFLSFRLHLCLYLAFSSRACPFSIATSLVLCFLLLSTPPPPLHPAC